MRETVQESTIEPMQSNITWQDTDASVYTAALLS